MARRPAPGGRRHHNGCNPLKPVAIRFNRGWGLFQDIHVGVLPGGQRQGTAQVLLLSEMTGAPHDAFRVRKAFLSSDRGSAMEVYLLPPPPLPPPPPLGEARGADGMDGLAEAPPDGLVEAEGGREEGNCDADGGLELPGGFAIGCSGRGRSPTPGGRSPPPEGGGVTMTS